MFTNLETAFMQSILAAVSSGDPVTPIQQTKRLPANWSGAGFGGTVRVGTAFGDLPIERLRVGDEVRTSSGKLARIQWIDKLHLDEDFLAKNPAAQPIRIPANTFGAGRPMQDMIVSQLQEICPDAHVAARFKPAVEVCSRTRSQMTHVTTFTYYRFHCGEPTTVRVDGVWVKVCA